MNWATTESEIPLPWGSPPVFLLHRRPRGSTIRQAPFGSEPQGRRHCVELCRSTGSLSWLFDYTHSPWAKSKEAKSKEGSPLRVSFPPPGGSPHGSTIRQAHCAELCRSTRSPSWLFDYAHSPW